MILVLAVQARSIKNVPVNNSLTISKIICYTKNMRNIIKNQQGLSLTMIIALGFAAAVVLVAIIGVIVYLVKA